MGSNPTAVSFCFSFSIVSKDKGIRREKNKKVLGGFEPPSLDSESRVLTVTPQDQLWLTWCAAIGPCCDAFLVTSYLLKLVLLVVEPSLLSSDVV